MIAINYAVGPRMMLHSGNWLDLLDPGASSFTIEDIAHGLAHLCRYTGQCSAFYSVAEHSLLVSDTVPGHAYAGLMHDAAEAFVGDVIRPLKQLLPEYKRIEASIESAIFGRFDVPSPMPKEVKEADLRVLAAEQMQVMPPETSRWVAESGIEPARVVVRHLRPEEAKQAFLDRFHRLRSRGAPTTRDLGRARVA